jgi:bifunctional non-homologous end joining protein LigD
MAPRDKLRQYREKRSFDATPEPSGAAIGEGEGTRFVVQEHHARRLHWDLRLEHDGVLASWALPRGVPQHPDDNRLAVRTEDHPLEYIDFHGEIPAGEYGAGTMEVWDAGTYEAEKFEDAKVVATFSGEKLRGRYALFRTRGKDWMIHRMDPAPEGWQPLPFGLRPMLATEGKQIPRKEAEWGFEIRWAGCRTLAFCDPGHLELVAGDGREVTRLFGEVRGVLEQLHGRPALLDGVVVAFGDERQPDRERLGRRLAAGSDSQIRRLRESTPVTYVGFDLLHLDGCPLVDQAYEERRSQLEALELGGAAWQVPAYHRGDGKAFRDAAAERGLPGVVAKRLASPYVAGRSTREWREIPARRR